MMPPSGRESRTPIHEWEKLKAVWDDYVITGITDDTGAFRYVNQKFCALSGYSRDELLGRNPRIISSGYHPPGFFLELWQTISEGKTWKGEIKNKAKDGSYYWVAATIVPLLNTIRQPCGYAVLWEDITDRKQTQLALQESEELLSKAFLLSPDGIIISRLPDGVILRANEAMCRLWDCRPGDMAGKPGREFITWICEEERDAFVRVLHETGECREYETTLRMADGRRLDFSISSRLIMFNGEACSVSILRDITERRRADAAAAQLAAIVQSSGDGIIGKDLNGIITSWNQGAEKIFGYSPPEMVGTSIMRLIPPDRQDEENHILGTIKRGENVEHFDTLRQTRDGRLIDVSVTASPIKDITGRICGVSKVVRDITGRRKAEQELRAGEERLRIVTENARVGLVMVNRDRRYIFANAAYSEILGLPPGTLVWRRVAEVLAPLYEEQIRPKLDRAFQGERVSYELILPSLQGDRHYSVKYEPKKEGDLVELVVVVITDITERKAAEAESVRRHAELQMILDAVPALVFYKDPESRFLMVNRALADLVGAPPEAFVGKTDVEMGAPDGERYREDDLQVMTTGEPVRQREETIHTARGICWLLTDKVPHRDGQGRIIGVIGFAVDITARKAAEEEIHKLNAELEQRVADRTAELKAANAELEGRRAELTSLFESLPGLYLVLTPELRIVAVSDAYLAATMTVREQILGRLLFDVFPENPEDPAGNGVSNLRASLDRVRQNGVTDTMAIQRYDIRRPGGAFETRYWSPVNSPVFGVNRQINYIVHRVEEVTEFVKQKLSAEGSGGLNARLQQMEAEIYQSSQKLQETNRKLETANNELEAFSYSVSHDLRAPLRAILGFSGIVRGGYAETLPPAVHEKLDRIQANAEKMGRLIEGLLEFSRLSRQRLHTRHLSTTALVQRVLEDFHQDRAAGRVAVTVQELPDCEADPTLLQQVFANLLSNAFKYTRNTVMPAIEIGCCGHTGENVFFVKDNGAGFSMEHAHRLFGVFQRLHGDHEFEGTGVGLAIVQRIIHRHGGWIRASAEPEKGAAFYFTLTECPACV